MNLTNKEIQLLNIKKIETNGSARIHNILSLVKDDISLVTTNFFHLNLWDHFWNMVLKDQIELFFIFFENIYEKLEAFIKFEKTNPIKSNIFRLNNPNINLEEIKINIKVLCGELTGYIKWKNYEIIETKNPDWKFQIIDSAITPILDEINETKINDIYYKFNKAKTTEEMQDQILILWNSYLKSYAKDIERITTLKHKNIPTFDFKDLKAKLATLNITKPETQDKAHPNLKEQYVKLNEYEKIFQLKQLFWKCLIALLCLKNKPPKINSND